MGALCVIPARGGSKRIPRKNIREFCGKPIIAYSIEAALQSELFDEVMVSTDDDEIAQVAREYGAKVPFMRSAKTSGDYATTAEVIEEVLEEYEKRERRFDVVYCVYPAAPFITPSELREARDILGLGATSVVPVTSFDFPPLRGFVIDEKAHLDDAFPEYAKARSQDLPEMVHDCGRFYCARVESFREAGSFLTTDVRALRIPARVVQDVDTFEDWEMAEMKFKLANKGASGETV